MIAENYWQDTVLYMQDEDTKFLCRKSTLIGNQPNLSEDVVHSDSTTTCPLLIPRNGKRT